MKKHFRQNMAWLHTWVGLTAAWVLFFVFITGTAGYFKYEIDRWMRPEIPLVSNQPSLTTQQAIELAIRHLQATPGAANAAEWGFVVPDERRKDGLVVYWRERTSKSKRSGNFHRAVLSNEGALIDTDGVRETGGGEALYHMHYAFRYMPRDWAIWLVGAATMLMLMALITGVIAHKKIFSDFFTFRPGKGQRSWLDAHNIVSVLALPFFLMITYSGLLYFQSIYFPLGVYGIKGPPKAPVTNEELVPPLAQLHSLLPLAHLAETRWGTPLGEVAIANPNRRDAVVTLSARHVGGSSLVRTGRDLRFDGVSGQLLEPRSTAGSVYFRQVMLALHEGRYADTILRWMYFASGLLGSAMVATGLVLWTVKRRRDQEARRQTGRSVAFGFRLVEIMNIATICGLCTAIAVYCWANRLLPVGLPNRADWEFHCLFIAWGTLLLHVALRLRRASTREVWHEQLWITAAAFAFLPLLNWLTTDRHLGVTLPARDWVLAGFDLTVLVLGLSFAVMAIRVRPMAQIKLGTLQNRRIHSMGNEGGRLAASTALEREQR